MELSRCHKVAVKEVIRAISMMKDRNGSTAKDVYFILDNIHGRVKRYVIEHALKSAVYKGLLNCKNNRYKLRRQRKFLVEIPNRGISKNRGMKPNCKSEFGIKKFNFQINKAKSMRSGVKQKSRMGYRTQSCKVRKARSSITNMSSISDESDQTCKGTLKSFLRCDCSTSTSGDSYNKIINKAQSIGGPLKEYQTESNRKKPKRRNPAPKTVIIVSKNLPKVKRAKVSSICKSMVSQEETKSYDKNGSGMGGVDQKLPNSNRTDLTTDKYNDPQYSKSKRTLVPDSKSIPPHIFKSPDKSKQIVEYKEEHRYHTRSKTKSQNLKRQSSSSSLKNDESSNKKLDHILNESVKMEDSTQSQDTS